MGFDRPIIDKINKVVAVRINIDDYIEKKVFFYIILYLAIYNLILEIL